MEDQKIRLTAEDWKNLIPSKHISIGSQQITVKPLGFAKLAETLDKIKSLQGELEGENITVDKYKTPEGILAITCIALKKMPELISDSCNLHIDDIKNLPIQIAVDIVKTILDSNIESQKGLLKNFQALAGKTTDLIAGVSAT
jgi:hypothetical protein